MIQKVLLVVAALFPVSEVVLALVTRSGARGARSEDQGSIFLLWFTILLGVMLAFAAQWVSSARLPVSPSIIAFIALVLMIGGLTIRWVAILTLGRHFTVDVAILPDHAVVDTGIYRFMRHPSYTGLLITFLGFGVMFGSWLSVIGVLVPITLGVLRRVAKEEEALLTSLGTAYVDYCARTKRFVPGLF